MFIYRDVYKAVFPDEPSSKKGSSLTIPVIAKDTGHELPAAAAVTPMGVNRTYWYHKLNKRLTGKKLHVVKLTENSSLMLEFGGSYAIPHTEQGREVILMIADFEEIIFRGITNFGIFNPKEYEKSSGASRHKTRGEYFNDFAMIFKDTFFVSAVPIIPTGNSDDGRIDEGMCLTVTLNASWSNNEKVMLVKHPDAVTAIMDLGDEDYRGDGG